MTELPGFGDEMVFTLFTNSASDAAKADEARVDRIGLDLESLKKSDRQDPKKHWISDHRVSEIHSIARAISNAELFARTNSPHPLLRQEVDALVNAGCRVLMLPYFRELEEVDAFVKMVAGRARVVLLVETAAAMVRFSDLVQLAGVDEVHIGLNDLHLDLKLRSHFELLCSDLLDRMADIAHAADMPFGFGGVARPIDLTLPIDPQLIYSQLARLGANRTLISRSFTNTMGPEHNFTDEVAATRKALTAWHKAGNAEQELARARIARLVSRLSAKRAGQSEPVQQSASECARR